MAGRVDRARSGRGGGKGRWADVDGVLMEVRRGIASGEAK